MLFGLNKTSKKLYQMQNTPISVPQLKNILYETYEVFKIWGRTEGRTKPSRNFSGNAVYSVTGPGGRAMSGAPYWIAGRYVPDGYVILYEVNSAGFRTFPIHRIKKVEKDGETFIVR